MILRRVSATAEARRDMSYFRGDILLTKSLRCIIVASPPHHSPGDSMSSTLVQSQRWFFGMLAEIKASAADTDGMYTLVEITAPAGLEAPLHVHYNEDEGFYVLEGSATIQVGDDTVELGPGQHAYGPRDVPHRFTIGPEGARMLWVLTPEIGS